MKNYIDLDTIKKHLNLDSFWHGDDFILSQYSQIAQDIVEKNIDYPLEDLEDEDGDIPSGLAGAILLYIGTLYDNRESVNHSTTTELPLGFRYILDSYRNYNPQNLKNNNSNNCCCNG